ncbi:probable ATP-dependent RNA helicase DHX37 isoform X3 [Amphibalanus amphitrite]|uniref:probable ATP-dependent RNA helicase DHX37 isoform X3 n=1 Tax=Amphibalanus amphitrite TaxID=1232801 RepID=UPI001C91F0C7|nr:probable ATP-dependent RNA helicase DHX37 isoform X3 [Amphibalanus amphitrite]
MLLHLLPCCYTCFASMGRLRKRYNEKARQKKDIKIQHAPEEKIPVVATELKNQQQDDSNALILPSKKRNTKDVTKSLTPKKLLSKKQRKKLEQIVQRKEKKQKRAGLLASLQQVQGDASLLDRLTGVTSVQTTGLKRAAAQERLRSVGGKRRRTHGEEEEREEGADQPPSDPNVIGTEVVMESESDDDEDEEEEEEEGDAPDGEEDGETSPTEPESASSAGQTPSTSGEPAAKAARTAGPVKQPAEDSDLRLQYTPVVRDREIQEARLKLPILAEEQQIVEAVRENPVLVLAGETGSGKTTQVPQFLYEAGYAREQLIGVTEPRRVAAVSMSRRVRQEMGLTADQVSYQIRFEGNTTDSTRIKFMTDGVLLKEIETDFLLNKYSVIIIDEAHERSVYTDILIGLLSRIVPLRNKRHRPLKLVIMSATLRVEDFTANRRLFKVPPPVIKVESRQFPVTVHWSKRTPDDYVGEAYRKACKIHRTLPDGGILIFVTGQNEVNSIMQRLKKTFPSKTQRKEDAKSKEGQKAAPAEKKPELTEEEEEAIFFNPKLKKQRKHKSNELPEVNLDSYAIEPPSAEAEDLLEGADGEGDDGDLEEDGDEDERAAAAVPGADRHPLHVLPLYAMLSTEKQSQVFEPVPEGARLCVVATNVAETSLTIPGIKYVIDTGKVKQKLYEKTTGVSAFQVMWESQAAANQRAGRAGRVAPGHCYRLFSSALFNDEMERFARPEIQRKPVEDVLLQMKAMHVDRVVNFPFPSPPDREQLRAAEERLVQLGALERPPPPPPGADKPSAEPETRVTDLGRAMACFPVSARFAKMLVLSEQHELLPFTVCLVAALSVQEVLLENPVTAEDKEHAKQLWSEWMTLRRSWAGTGNSLLLGDAMVLIRAVGAAEYSGCTPEFCRRYGLRLKAMREIRKLRVQLTNQINLVVPSAALGVDPRLAPPSEAQCRLLRQVLLAGLPDHVARRVDPQEINNPEDRPKWKGAYRCTSIEEPVFLHRGSVLRKEAPQYVAYQEIYETNKLYMRGVTAVEPEWLATLCPGQCTFSKPLDEPPPEFDPVSGRVRCYMTATFGRAVWPLPPVQLDYPAGLDRYRLFGVHLLRGDVCPRLAELARVLLAPPATMTKSWARLHPRTDSLLKALVAENCDNRDTLLDVWQRRPTYLLSAYKEWIPEILHDKVAQLWPPCDRPAESES